jgi:hypothetical protein
MLLKNRAPRIDCQSVKPARGLEHVRDEWIAILRWLHNNKVEFVLIGAVAESVRGNAQAAGPVAIVPAPHRRNLERLAHALTSERARLRSHDSAENTALKLTPERFIHRMRWELRCGTHDIDVECGVRAADDGKGVPSYQEMVYEAARFELESGFSVDVASPEDVEHFAQLRRTGVAPEIRIKRRAKADARRREPDPARSADRREG